MKNNILKAITLLAIVSSGLLFTAQKSENTRERFENDCREIVRSIQVACADTILKPSQEELNHLTIEEIDKRIKEIQAKSQSLLIGTTLIRTEYYSNQSQTTIESMMEGTGNVLRIFARAEGMYKTRLTVLEKNKVDHAK